MSNLCVPPGGGSSNPSGGTVGETGSSGTEGPTSGPTSGLTSGDPTGSPTGSPTSSPTGDPTGSPTSDPSTSGTDTNPDPSDPTLPDNCMQIQLDKVPANVMLVVERSGSTKVEWDQGLTTKWDSIHQTLTAAVAKNQATLKLGLMLFPALAATSSYNETACITNAAPEVPLAINNGAKISATLPGPGAIGAGGSPLARGLTGALTALKAAPASEGRAMVLISDGAFNCAVDAPDTNGLFETLDNDVHTIVDSAWKQDKISTQIVGVGVTQETSGALKDGGPDNVNPYYEFDTLAVEGGQPRPGADKFYAAYTENELAGFMLEAIDRANTCILALGLTPPDPAATVVKVEGTSYAYDPGINCAADSGWIYSDANNNRIQMCGAACTALKAAGSAEVVVCG